MTDPTLPPETPEQEALRLAIEGLELHLCERQRAAARNRDWTEVCRLRSEQEALRR